MTCLLSLTAPVLSGTAWSGQYTYTLLYELILQELTAALQHKRETSPGMDSITYSMLTNLPLNRQHQILEIFNAVLIQDEMVHEDWKDHMVIPLKKPGGALNTTSYWPILPIGQ